MKKMCWTRCGWAFPIDLNEAESPSRETAVRVAVEFERHDCADFPRKKID